MKKIHIISLISFVILISAVLFVDNSEYSNNKLAGFVVMELNKSPYPPIAGFTAFFILIVASFAYFYGTNKFGPA